MTYRVACMDVWAPAVRDVVIHAAPPELALRFATSYDPAEQLALAGDAEILLPGFAAVTADMLARCPQVRMIQKWGIGIDSIDLDAVRERGIALAITAGANAGPVAELAIALMLAVYRRIPYANRAMREGRWPTPEMRETCFQITGKTIGLVGFGNIGRMLARRLRGFDANVIYVDTQRADAATEQALFNALVSGKLRGAGLDAFDPEPPAMDNPLLGLDQVVVTPHAGGGFFDNVGNVARHAFGNILHFLRGEPIAAADLVMAGRVRVNHG